MNLPTKQLHSDQPDLKLPWTGIQSVARFWAGAGSFLDWLVPSDWDIEVNWNVNKVRARVAEAVLLRFQQTQAHLLPSHAGEWLDLLGQQLVRTSRRLEYPTSHTDWGSTLSEFGRYPSPFYVERRPIGTYDTPLNRVLKWVCISIQRAERLVSSEFGRLPLSSRVRNQMDSALQLSEIMSASDELRPSAHDLDACRSSGGLWIILTRLADQLSAIWFGQPLAQLQALAPILPDFAHQLFELGTVGTIVDELRDNFDGLWQTSNPIAAAKSGEPCFKFSSGQLTVEAYFQTVPASEPIASPYRKLANAMGGGSLRPDIWVRVYRGSQCTELVVECKFSLDNGYVASGITQSLAYMVEFPAGTRERIHIAVGPSEVITQPRSWDKKVVLADVRSSARLVAAVATGSHLALLDSWN